MSLNPKQQAFVNEYLKDLNGTQAAIRAGYSAKTANEQAAQLLAKLSIQEAIRAAQAARSERTKIDQDWVLKRWAAIADADITRVLEYSDGGVSFKPSEDLEWADAYTITEVSCKESIKEDEGGKELVLNREKKIKQADKLGALNAVAKHLGMLNEKLMVSGDAANPIKIDVDLSNKSDAELFNYILSQGGNDK